MASNAEVQRMRGRNRQFRSHSARGLLAGAALVLTLVVGNVAILSAHVWARTMTGMEAKTGATDTHNFHVIDDKLIRGGKPSEDTYRYLADQGVTTVVDLRAEEWVEHPTALLKRLGIDLVRIPMRDGQAPSEEQVDRFISAIRASEGRVYVHCMAGVGRTGTMVAAYLVRMRGVDPLDAVAMNLAVGPPSLEQIAFAAQSQRPDPLVTAVSRVLDAPRRLWTYVN